MANNPFHIVALSKAWAKKNVDAARDLMPVGTHEVDFTVHISGTMKVLEDTDKTPTVSIPMKEVLALFIRYCGITREAAITILTRAMNEALEESNQGAGALAAELPIIDEIIDSIVTPMLLKLKRTPVKGAVKADLEITEVKELVTA